MLPNLDRLCREGTWASVKSVSELSSGSIWPTFFTGVNPAKHGQFFTHMQLFPGTYKIVKKYADDVPYDPFWIELHRSGKFSAIIDVPQTRPLKNFRGIHVAGWGGEYPAWPRSSTPSRIIHEIDKKFGKHPLADKYGVAYRPENNKQYQLLTNDLLHGSTTKGNLSLWIFNKGRHDFFLTVFSEPHWAMHLLWDVLDEHHPGRNEEIANRYSHVFGDILGKIDKTIGKLLQAAPKANFLVFSLSGMGPNYSGWHILPTVLERIGINPGVKETGYFNSLLPMPRWGSWKTRALEGIVSLRTIEMAKALLPTRFWDRWTRRILYTGSSWNQSRAFCLPNDYSGAIRINLKGREPDGIVTPGAEYQALCDEITEALLDLKHLETGHAVVSKVIQTNEVYSGENLAALPDLIVLWTNESPVTGVSSPRVDRINLDFPERRTGAHRPCGFLVASGPRIRKGLHLDQIHLLNLAPTILHLLDVEVPKYYDGYLISELIDK
jgi:predicted AlkP superfamily phosphohydrolase/phosphomutase